MIATFDSHIIFKKLKGKVGKSGYDTSGNAVLGFMFMKGKSTLLVPSASFFNMSLEAVTSEFQRQARDTISSGSFLMMVLIQMDLFHDAEDYPEHSFMSVSVIIYEHQKETE